MATFAKTLQLKKEEDQPGVKNRRVLDAVAVKREEVFMEMESKVTFKWCS